MYPRGSIYIPPNRQWRVESKHSQGIWKDKSQVIWDSMRKNPKTFRFMQISRCTWVLAQKLCIHMSMAFNVTYRYKHVIFGDNLGTSKYNIGKWGPKSLHRDMEGHKGVIY